MLYPGPVVVLEIFLNLRLLAPLGRFIEREFDPSVAVRHDLRHQGRVLGGNVLIVEVLIEGKAHDGGVEVDPTVHLVPAHIAYHVIYVKQACGTSQMVVALPDVSGEKGTVIVLALDKGVNGVAVNGDGCS